MQTAKEISFERWLNLTRQWDRRFAANDEAIGGGHRGPRPSIATSSPAR